MQPVFLLDGLGDGEHGAEGQGYVGGVLELGHGLAGEVVTGGTYRISAGGLFGLLLFREGGYSARERAVSTGKEDNGTRFGALDA